MLLTKSRIPIVTLGIILLFGSVLFLMAEFLMAERTSADDSVTPFGNSATDLSWAWTWDDPTDTVTVCFVLGSGWVDGNLGEVHDIEIFVDPAVTDTYDLIAEGPVDGPGGAGHYAVNTYYCAGTDGATPPIARPLQVTGVTTQPTLVGIHLVSSDPTHTTHTKLATASTQVTASAVAGTGPSIDDVGWDWTFDKVRGLQVCLNRGATWPGTADDIEVWVGGVSKGAIGVPSANTISCNAISGVGPTTDPAPTSVALGVRDATDNTIGVLPAPVNAGLLIPADLGWDYQNLGNALRVKVKLGTSLPSDAYFIEVYPIPPIAGQENSPALTQGMPGGSALPTNLTLDLDPIGLTAPATSVKVQFLDMSGNLITFNEGLGINDEEGGPLNPPAPTPTPPAPTPTPVNATDVPTSDITTVSPPTGGAATVIQPSAAATVSAPDASVSVAVPAVANTTAFQLVYNPSPATVPAAAPGQNVLRAFELNAYDTNGTQISLTLLRTVTITVNYTTEDVAAAPQLNPINLKIASYNTATQAWTPLTTTLDLAAQTLTAKASHLSLFGLVGVEPAPQVVGTPMPTATATATATAIVPPTGDFAPGSGLVLALILAGFLLITAGGAYLIQNRSARS